MIAPRESNMAGLLEYGLLPLTLLGSLLVVRSFLRSRFWVLVCFFGHLVRPSVLAAF